MTTKIDLLQINIESNKIKNKHIQIFKRDILNAYRFGVKAIT